MSRLAPHRGVPLARDFFPTDSGDAYVLVLNDAPGNSLRVHLTKPDLQLTMDQKLRVARDVLEALAHWAEQQKTSARTARFCEAEFTDTALGTIRSLEATVQGFEERAAKLETDIADARKRATELDTKVGAPFEKEERYQQLNRRQSEIEEKLDLTKNQAPSQVDADLPDENAEKNSETQDIAKTVRQKRRAGVTV